MAELGTALADVAARFREDQATPEELSTAFADAVVFCRREEEVGFAAVGTPGAGWIPMYSSEEALRRGEGTGDWFAMIGAELLMLVPEGYGVVLDHGSSSEVWLEPWAIVKNAAA